MSEKVRLLTAITGQPEWHEDKSEFGKMIYPESPTGDSIVVYTFLRIAEAGFFSRKKAYMAQIVAQGNTPTIEFTGGEFASQLELPVLAMKEIVSSEGSTLQVWSYVSKDV